MFLLLLLLLLLVDWALVAMLPKFPKAFDPADGVVGLFAHEPEFQELAASAFIDGAASFVFVLPSPSNEINPEAFDQISFELLLVLLLLF